MTDQTQFPSFDMAAIAAPNSFSTSGTCAMPMERTRTHRRRLTPQSGRALEVVGHAIEYLADETAHLPGEYLDYNDPRIQAIRILMRANRTIYYEAPIVPGFGYHLRALLGFV